MDFLRGLGSGAEVGARVPGELGVPSPSTDTPSPWEGWIHPAGWILLDFPGESTNRHFNSYSFSPILVLRMMVITQKLLENLS